LTQDNQLVSDTDGMVMDQAVGAWQSVGFRGIPTQWESNFNEIHRSTPPSSGDLNDYQLSSARLEEAPWQHG